MSQIHVVGLDLAKQIFQVHAIGSEGAVVVRRQLRRSQVLTFFSKLPSCLVGMEACGGAHFWAREIASLGHQVRLMPPSYVKPYVKRGKTDAGDAEAICEAVSRPTMRFVPVKTAEQQASAMVLKTRDLLASAQPSRQCVSGSPLGVRYRERHRDQPGGRSDWGCARS